MPEAVIVDAVRTPIGRAFKGSLAGLRPDDTTAFVLDQLLERNGDVDPASVAIGDRVTMTFRRLYTSGGVHNYFWKARPLTEQSEES